MQTHKKKLVVVGGGASGFFTAINAAVLNPELDIILLEKNSKVLQKVKVSGGGRCNVTHNAEDHLELITKYPRGKNFLKKAFSIFTVKDTISWFEARGVKLHTESDGRMFPNTNQSESIVHCLLQEALNYKVDIRYNAPVVDVTYKNQFFSVILKNGQDIQADYLCISSGGYQHMLQYDWLKKLHHTIVEPVPSLFTFNIPNSPIIELMGLSVQLASIKVVNSKMLQHGALLITHWGLSGPCVLKLSAWGAREFAEKKYHFSILVNWINVEENQLRENWNAIRNSQSNLLILHKNPFNLPTRLWKYITEQADIPQTTKWSELTSKHQNKLIGLLTAMVFDVKGKTTFKEEFVTCGGISLTDVDSKTMMSKKIPHLYFTGEVLDIDGVTGGYNFQNAWTTGFIAAQSIGSESLLEIKLS